MTNLTTETEEKSQKVRFRWIDEIRGLAIVYLLVCNVLHWPEGNEILDFFFAHPSSSATWMSLRDVTASAFIFIMGLLFGYVFRKQWQRSGPAAATWHQFYRYGLILVLGVLVSFIQEGSLLRARSLPGGTKLTVIVWDVLQVIGLVGLAGIPFLFLRPGFRAVAGYLMIVFYQVMLTIPGTGWKLYAVKSVHGGILASCFAFSGQLIIASAMGEYFFSNVKKNEGATYRVLLIFALANLALGLGLTFIPEMEASKRQVSLAYCMICMGTTLLAGLCFVLLERRGIVSTSLEAFGRNPFLIYIAAVIVSALLYDVLLEDLSLWIQMSAGVACLAAISAAAILLYHRGRIIKTETISIIGVILATAAAAYRLFGM